MSDRMVWKGEGFCKMRSIRKYQDYCNDETIRGGNYCRSHTCVIHACKASMAAEYPMLAGQPRFCSKHHNPQYAGRYGCDFSGPDDFDYPD